MTTTETIPVLDDNTRDAFVIGTASTEAEALAAWESYMAARMDADDLAELPRPAYVRRSVSSLSPALQIDCPNGAFEPL